jgi:AraC family transcriptional regulator
LQDELSLLELSRIADLSPPHFAAAFKTSVGIPPHRYVIERRIDLAGVPAVEEVLEALNHQN